MKLSTAIETFAQELRASGKSAATVHAYHSDLNRLRVLCRHDTVLEVTADMISRYFVLASEDGLRMSTVHRKAAALREFGKWGLRRGLWNMDPFIYVPNIRRPDNVPRPFTEDESKALLGLELNSTDRLLRSLLFYTGLRVTPITLIKIGDISLNPPTIRCLVKGAKVQVVRMHPTLAQQVQDYTLAHAKKLAPQEYLLNQANGKPLTRRMVELRTKKWGVLAGVTSCLPHRFRHSFATRLLQQDVNLRTIQAAMGHADIKSTTIYTRVHDAQIDEALRRLEWEKPKDTV